MANVKSMLGKVLKVSRLYLPPFSSYGENPAGGDSPTPLSGARDNLRTYLAFIKNICSAIVEKISSLSIKCAIILQNCRDVMPSEVREKPVSFTRFVDRPPGDEVGDMGSGLHKSV